MPNRSGGTFRAGHPVNPLQESRELLQVRPGLAVGRR